MSTSTATDLNHRFTLMSSTTPASSLRLPPRSAEVPVRPSDPAVRVVTDFTSDEPVLITRHLPIDEALDEMIRSRVRALLVTHDDLVVGLITSYDIQGQRPLEFVRATNFSHHYDIEVGDIMTPWSALTTLDWQAIQEARVSDLDGMLRKSDATHLVVIERSVGGDTFVRGLVSRTRLERQLHRGRSLSSLRQRAS